MGNWQTVIVATIKKCERKRLGTERKELFVFYLFWTGIVRRRLNVKQQLEFSSLHCSCRMNYCEWCIKTEHANIVIFLLVKPFQMEIWFHCWFYSFHDHYGSLIITIFSDLIVLLKCQILNHVKNELTHSVFISQYRFGLFSLQNNNSCLRLRSIYLL